MKEDPVVILLSLIVVVTAVASLCVSFVWSLPYAIRRMRRYRIPGSAKRLFAQFTLSNTVLPLACMIAFLVVGVTTLGMDDTSFRLILVRALVMFAVFATATQIILTPIGHKYVENAAENEHRNAQDTSIREIASETLAAVRDVQQAAELVRTKLKEHDELRVAHDEIQDTKQGEHLRLSQNISNEQERVRNEEEK